MPRIRIGDRRRWVAAAAAGLMIVFPGCPQAPPGGEVETFMLPGDVPLEMVWIPGGTFLMGRYPGEQESWEGEDPQHQVTVPGFWMGKHELTKAQWTAVMGTTPWAGQEHVLDDPKSPAVYVTWSDAKLFLRALALRTGKVFRLPSEAEWEYACRAGTTTRFYWGDDPDYSQYEAYCWCGYYVNEADGFHARAVGQKLPNAFGLYDMSGNAWEWCEDDLHFGYVGAPVDGSAWVDSPRRDIKSLRGGSWIVHATAARSACRASVDPAISNAALGFRLAR